MVSDLRHPLYDLDQSLDVARQISERGSGATVSGDELAKLLDYSGVNNGAYLTRVSAARLFGLIEGRGAAIAVTDRAENILHPDYPATSDRARIDAFRSVPLYSAFLDAFRGRELPDEKGMQNALVSRFRISPKVARSVLLRLLATADQAGLFRIAGSRTRMIEPTFGPTPAAPAEVEKGAPEAAPPEREMPTRRFPKIIDGVLELMPSAPPWDPAEYSEWLTFFDQACRVYYRIPRRGSNTAEE
jgi:hypothetical protein